MSKVLAAIRKREQAKIRPQPVKPKRKRPETGHIPETPRGE